MNIKQIFDTDTILRDLAEQYAHGLYTTDEYLDIMEDVCRRQAECQPTH